MLHSLRGYGVIPRMAALWPRVREGATENGGEGLQVRGR